VDRRPAVARGLAAGDRLCDAPLASVPEERPSSVLRLIQSTRHTLLLLSGSKADAIAQLLEVAGAATAAFPDVLAPQVIVPNDWPSDRAGREQASASVPTWCDKKGQLHEKLHTTDASVLVVRPDGYLGYRGPADAAALVEYLGSYLVRKA